MLFVVEPNKDAHTWNNIHNKHKEKYITTENMQSTTYSKYYIHNSKMFRTLK